MKSRILLVLAALIASACVSDGDAPIHMQDPEGDEFRQGMISTDDIAMDFKASNTRQQELEGQVSMLAALTADAVISTNVWVFAHIQLMRAISIYPPTSVEENERIWEGADKGNFYRVSIKRTEQEDGTLFSYSFHGRLETEPESELRPLLDGEVLRTTLGPKPDGDGIVRFYFDNLSHLDPESSTEGTARVAFRKEDGVRQVHNRMVNMVIPEDQSFPEFAEYSYRQNAGGGGKLSWFSKGDIKEDGEPYEFFSAHTTWLPDYSGAGTAVAFGGSIDVDQWNLVECWSTNLRKGYDSLSVPNTTLESGDKETCVLEVEELEIPPFQETLPDEDPEIPASTN